MLITILLFLNYYGMPYYNKQEDAACELCMYMVSFDNSRLNINSSIADMNTMEL